LIDRYEELTPLAHGQDVVTVILADFRGFDTMGEVTVIALVMLGVMSLIRKGRLR
jgi:multicomponent Na+:H+ antiporter subunit A